MSTVDITITTQPKDGGQTVYGSIDLELHIQGVVYDIGLMLSPVDGYLRFEEVLWFTPQADADAAQALNYLTSMKRDHGFVGSPPPDPITYANIGGTVSGNVVTLTARNGTFHNGAYTGDILQSVGFVYNNTAQEDPKTFVYQKTGSGTCLNEEYQANSASGGNGGPYNLNLNGVNVVSGWDGVVPQQFNLLRADYFTGGLYDSAGTLIQSVQINPTKNLQASDFKHTVVPYTGFSDLTIVTVVNRPGTEPLEYNLVNPAGAETGWQASPTFGGIAPGNYTIKIRDVYQCEVSKVIAVSDVQAPSQTERVPYFDISEYNSLSFFREAQYSDEVRKGYENTPSWLENVGLPKNGYFSFPEGYKVPTQFRSYFPYHAVTLHRYGSTSVPLQFFMIQENLGLVEKVDCELFLVQQVFTGIDGSEAVINNGTGVFFNGGVQYEPNSSTPKADPDSPYTSGLPPWAIVGNFVQIDTQGTFQIVETDLYDEGRDVIYFRLEEVLSVGTAQIQATWDRHPYNVFRVDFDMSLVNTKGAYIRIEPGVEQDGTLIIDQSRIHRSEWITKLTDTSQHLRIQWSAFRNIGKMLFIDGIKCEMWVKGRIRPFSSTEAEFDDAEDRARSIDQKAYLRMRGFFPLMSVRHWRKLDLVGAIGSRGNVFVEGMELVRINPSEEEPQGTTNLSNITVEFAFSGESTAIGPEDPVYDLDTGSEQTPGTGKEPVTGWQADNFRLVTEDDKFVKVLDDGVEKYVEID